jgi:HlyD family secretion protein
MSAGRASSSLLDVGREIWRLLDAAQRRRCVSVLLISVAAACLALVGVTAIAPFFAVLSDPTIIDRSSALTWLRSTLGLETSRSVLVCLGVGFVALLSLANAANLLAILWIGRFSHGVGARLHTLLFAEYLHRDIAFHASSNTAVLANRVVHDVNRTVGGVIQSALTLSANAVVIVLIAGAIVIVDPFLAFAAALALSASYAVIYSLVRRRLMRNGAITTRHWARRAQVIAESFGAIKDVLVHRAQPSLVARLQRHSAAIAAAQASTPAIAASPRYALECVMAAGLVGAALWIYGTAGAERWLPQLAFLGLAAYRLLPAVQQLFGALARIHADYSAFEGIVDDLRAARRRNARPLAAPSAFWRTRPRQAIRLVDVSHRYSPHRPGGVSEVSFEIPAGTLVGLVGPNGAGKTTLAEIVLGLLVPNHGRIEIDGVALDDENRHAWLDNVAYVPQQVALVDGTLAQNVAFGVAADDVDPERMIEAVRGARLEATIAAMPIGLATEIGEDGARLSGGQRQRVGIARALYRRASLLVVDEGTNALDMLTEAEILALLGALRGTCTIILIGHRPSALAGCDLVFELENGRVVGRKTKAQLANGLERREIIYR